MKVILQRDVKNVGKVGDVVNVAKGYARNYLFPRKLAQEATDKRMKEYQHLQQVAEAQRKKAQADRQTLTEKLDGLTLNFKKAAGETDKLFGSVSEGDISDALARQGFEVDKRDVHLEEPIKFLGQYKAEVKLGEGLKADLTIAVDREG